MNVLLSLAAIAALVWFWADSARAREQVLERCRALCEEMSVQFLDQTVSLIRLLPARREGRLRLRRWYGFEYSLDGKDRWRGTAELWGRRIQTIHMQLPDGPVIVNNASRFGV
jgi:hypothetical protein